MKLVYLYVTYIIISFLVGCGSSSSGDGTLQDAEPTLTTAKGQFFDSYVSGLQYASGSTIGTTDASGTFTYEIVSGVPQPVSFYIGDIKIGSATGSAFITPMDLKNSDAAGLLEQQNIVRFLLSIDNDGNPDNGINISEITDNSSSFSWAAIDFSDAGFDTSQELVAFFSDASSILSKNITLIDALTADTHINNTYRCLVSGNYYGEFNGDDNGPIVLAIDPFTGFMAGVGWTRFQSTGIGIPFGSQSLNQSNGFSFVATSDNSFVFNGVIDGFDSAMGTWSENAKTGSFSLTRIATLNSGRVDYRFTGAYLANIPQVGEIPIGAFSINLLDNGTVEGELVNIIFGITKVTSMSGTVSNGELSMAATNGMTLSANLDINMLTITGVWSDPSGFINSGSFSMNGCALK